jgi:hypothetical protein
LPVVVASWQEWQEWQTTRVLRRILAMKADTAAVLASQGLRLSEAKTHITHVDSGFDFLGFRIQRRPREGKTARS